MREKPFLYLLENLDKVNIDERMISVFKEVLINMENYFEEHNLLGVADFASIFDKYFINDSDKKIKIVLKERSDEDNCYLQEKMEIEINVDELNVHRLTHEFIHSLVWKDKENSVDKNEMSHAESFMDEGATESLARKISGYVPNENISTYNENVEFSRFLENLYGEEEFYKFFFLGKSFQKEMCSGEDYYTRRAIILKILRSYEACEDFYEKRSGLNKSNSENLFRELEMELTQKVLENYLSKKSEFSTINDIIEFVKRCSNRPLKSASEMRVIYNEVINRYLERFNLDDLTKYELHDSLAFIISKIDELYLYGPKYTTLELSTESKNDFIYVYLDSKGNPIKSDLEVSKGMMGYFAYESSNDKDRKCYRADYINLEEVDFSKEPNSTKAIIKSGLNRLFDYSDDITKSIINELLIKYCSIDINSVTSENIDEVTSILFNSIDPILFSSISGRIEDLTVSYGTR